MKETDNVNHPAHYQPRFNARPVECIDVTRHLPFDLGNAFKYVWRAGSKGSVEKAVEDLKKARWYLGDWRFLLGDLECRPVAPVAARTVFGLLEPDGSHRYAALEAILYGDIEHAIDTIEAMIREMRNENHRPRS